MKINLKKKNLEKEEGRGEKGRRGKGDMLTYLCSIRPNKYPRGMRAARAKVKDANSMMNGKQIVSHRIYKIIKEKCIFS